MNRHNNNAAELEMRDAVVPHRSVSRQLSGLEGRQASPVLVSVARTCQKLGVFPRVAVERTVMDPDWRIFRPPDRPERGQAVLAVPVTTTAAAR